MRLRLSSAGFRVFGVQTRGQLLAILNSLVFRDLHKGTKPLGAGTLVLSVAEVFVFNLE